MNTVVDILKDNVLGLFTEKTQIIEIADVVDLYPEENHSVRILKTSQPIESGSSITDNTVIAPQKLRMTGFVSNLVPTGIAALPASERGKEAWIQIEELAKRREPVTVQTTLKIYENLLIVDLSARVDANTGLALDFTIDLEEILFANSEFTMLPADILAGPATNKSGTVDGGGKQSPNVPERRGPSILFDLLGDI
jgi:hypothetical protein